MIVLKMILLFIGIWTSPKLLGGFLFDTKVTITAGHSLTWALSWALFITLQWLI